MNSFEILLIIIALSMAVGAIVGYFIPRWLRPKPEKELLTPRRVEEVRKSFDELLAEALERNPPLPKVTGLKSISGHDSPCPRCGSLATTIEFMAGMHHGCPDERMREADDRYASIFGYVNYDLIAQNQRIAEAAVEHHDRQCFNCEFRWVEATV